MSSRYLPGKSHQLPRHRQRLAHYQGQFIRYECQQSVATITLNRPEKKNPLTFDSYAELRDLFRAGRHTPILPRHAQASHLGQVQPPNDGSCHRHFFHRHRAEGVGLPMHAATDVKPHDADRKRATAAGP